MKTAEANVEGERDLILRRVVTMLGLERSGGEDFICPHKGVDEPLMKAIDLTRQGYLK